MTNNYNDIIEQQIFEFTRNDKSVPSFVDDAIRSAMSRVKPTNNLIYKIKKIIIFILSLGIMTTSAVFAKDIVKFFKSIFTNTTPGINSAIENGKVYNIDMDFVYNNNVGIKVNSVVEDDNVIDIAFVFDCPEQDGITNIVLSDFEVFDGYEKILNIQKSEEKKYYINNEEDYSEYIQLMNDFKKVDNLYYKSILFNIEEKVDVKNLKLNISQVQIYKDKEINNINGNWSFNLKLNKNDRNNPENILEKTGEYNINYNKNIIKEVSYEINDTNFVINIDFLDKFDTILITEIDNIILKDDLNNMLKIKSAAVDDENYNINIESDFGRYNLPEKINLYIKYDDNKDTIIEFYK